MRVSGGERREGQVSRHKLACRMAEVFNKAQHLGNLSSVGLESRAWADDWQEMRGVEELSKKGAVDQLRSLDFILKL